MLLKEWVWKHNKNKLKTNKNQTELLRSSILVLEMSTRVKYDIIAWSTVQPSKLQNYQIPFTVHI